MAQANALADLGEVKAFLGVTTSADDALIEALTDAASDRIEQLCQTAFIIRSFVEYHEGARKRLFLQRYPITEVTSIADPAGNTIPATDYIIKKDRGILEHFGHFWVAQTTGGQPTQWTVTYKAGRFADTSVVTEDLKLACKQLVAKPYDQKVAGVSSVGVGDLSISYASAGETPLNTPPEVVALLSPYFCNLVP
jgi:uncharacterized phiE125 gp8 family phage protein